MMTLMPRIYLNIVRPWYEQVSETEQRKLLTLQAGQNLSALFFGQALYQMGQKMPIFGPKCQFWAKFGRFWARNPIFWGQGVKIPRIGIPMRHLFRVENIDRWGSNWPLGAKMCFFDPKIWIFGAKSQFFV